MSYLWRADYSPQPIDLESFGFEVNHFSWRDRPYHVYDKSIIIVSL